MNFTCRICGNTDHNQTYAVREMMFGFRELFDYVACGRCGCLQIKTIPNNLEKYYPDNYYSLEKRSFTLNPLRVFLKKQIVSYRVMDKMNPLGWLLDKKFKREDFYNWFNKIGATFSDSILDVGSGSGELLMRLRKSGFTHVVGVDPFIKEDIHYAGGLTIHKKTLSEITGSYKIIIFNHSFEHLADPKAIVQDINRLLVKGGYALIRIPVTGTYAWKKYGVNWVQLDAPRHLYLHTPKSVQFLCDTAGLKLKDFIYDSYDLQFWGSEQYLRDIPLKSDKSFSATYEVKNSIFTVEQFASFVRQAAELNAVGQGDQATFFIHKPE